MHIELFRERILIEFYRNRIQPLKVKASKDATDKKQKTKFSIASLTGARIKLNFRFMEKRSFSEFCASKIRDADHFLT